jgi:immunity protein 5 of polymorphic toxin system
MNKSKMAVTSMDASIAELANKTDHKILAIWAADCAERVLPYFEANYPADSRPRKAVEACREWAHTGVFKMADVRKTSLAAHTAAREVGDDHAARAAARAAGQAMATAHVPAHAIAAAIYAATAVRDAPHSADADAATYEERVWQYQHLLALGENVAARADRLRT